ncbi:DUF2929 family protein [Catellicoccus marimammalium]|uniref:DUF2929 domain-containing protein n=1 Tax=Catellicoccus marimammalium M35/04/3 TaxID=1234409 RepID=K8ZQ33_9ENTE|nr:DUF2929 family protein [Catellicoccus marimammalium]EKU27691.1 hypothetical protein C683_0472 [Catellicoccus marimammalium M35/04/3]
MRYLVILFWSLILGQVVGFIGAKLTMNAYAFIPTVIASIVVALIVMLIDAIAIPTPKKQ